MTFKYHESKKIESKGDHQNNSFESKRSNSFTDFTEGQTAVGVSQIHKSNQNIASMLTEQNIPTTIRDPFDPDSIIDLTAVDLPNFNLVDGTVRVATDTDWPFVLLKGYDRDRFFYAPRWGRLSKRPNGEPAFTITKKVRNNPDGSKTTLGGILSFLVEIVTELPDQQMQKEWADFLKRLHDYQPQSGAFNFQPLQLTHGKMNVFGLDSYAKPGQALKDIDVGASDSIGFAIELTPDGADHFAAMIGAKPHPFPPQVAINFRFRYQYLIPECRVQAHGYKKKTYDYFSADVKARYSYFGLVNGSFDYKSVQADLKQADGLTVSIIGQPPAGIDPQKLIDSIFDQFVKLEVGKWIEPDPTPVDAPNPGGWYGGVSVKMKSITLSDNAQFDQILNFAGIKEEIFNISFNFENQIAELDKDKHLFIEEDDTKLSLKLVIDECDKVSRIVPSASYTTSTGPRNVNCQSVGSQGGESDGIIQFTYPDRPNSTQISLIVDFIPGVGPGYIYKETQPVSENGAQYYFCPDQFVNRTHILFSDAVKTKDLRARAYFSWKWIPPQNLTSTRQPISRAVMFGPDQNGEAYNIPTYDLEFPYHPNDYTGESTPKINYDIKGLSGEWDGLHSSGTIQLGEPILDVGWTGARSIGESLVIPALLTKDGIPDPAYKQRLASMRANKKDEI